MCSHHSSLKRIAGSRITEPGEGRSPSNLKTARPEIVIRASVAQRGPRGNRLSRSTGPDLAISHNREDHGPRLAVERLGPMIDPLVALIGNSVVVADFDQYGPGGLEQRAEKHLVLLDRVGIDGGLALIRVVPDNAAGGSAGCGGEAVPVLHLVVDDVEVASFVFCDVVGQEITHAFVRHIVDIDAGTGGDLAG